MKKIICIALACVMLIALCACEPATSDDKFVVNACIASEPETIDPNLTDSVDAANYTMHTFEGLMKYSLLTKNVADDANMFDTEVTYGMAKSYTISDDELVYTFTLRDDIKWSDGVDVKASDFVYSWRRVVDPETAAEYGYILDGIVLNAAAIQAGEKQPSELGIEAVDDKTVKITLEAPCAYFVSLCSFATLVPVRQDIIEKYGSDWTKPENMVSNGAYKYSAWTHESNIKMVPNTYYYDYENLGPDEIVWWLSADQTAVISSYQSGDYQFCNDFPTEMISSLQASGDCFINPYIGTYYLYINCEEFTDWRVRAALTLAIDRENIVKNVTMAGETPATGLVAAGITDSTGAAFSNGQADVGVVFETLATLYPDADLTTYAGRCALAKKLLADAVADGFDATKSYVYNFNTSDSHKKIAEACAEDWKTVLGINIELANQEWNVYTNGLGEHTFDIARLGWIADYDDAITYLELVKTGNSNNYGVWSNAEYDALIEKAKSTAPGAERDAILRQAEELMFSEGGFPLCPLYFYTQVYCMKGVKNVGYTSLGYFFFMYAKEA